MQERIDTILKPDKEPAPEKVVLLVRHPSTASFDSLLDEAEKEGVDIEQKLPVDKEGLKMTRELAQYLKTNLKQVGESMDIENVDRQYTIWTSPIRRAQTEADIVMKNVKLAATADKSIPLPANNEPNVNDSFGEVSWMFHKKEGKALMAQAEAEGKKSLQFYFENYPDDAVARINERLPDILKGMEQLKEGTPIHIVFSHSLTIALMLWIIEQQQKGVEDMTVTQTDLVSIQELAKQSKHTSITEIRKQGDVWKMQAVGQTPHLSV